jgi:hypothetical protein
MAGAQSPESSRWIWCEVSQSSRQNGHLYYRQLLFIFQRRILLVEEKMSLHLLPSSAAGTAAHFGFLDAAPDVAFRDVGVQGGGIRPINLC